MIEEVSFVGRIFLHEKIYAKLTKIKKRKIDTCKDAVQRSRDRDTENRKKE